VSRDREAAAVANIHYAPAAASSSVAGTRGERRDRGGLARLARLIRAFPIKVHHGEAAIPIACWRAKAALEALDRKRIAVLGQRAGGFLSPEQARKRLAEIGEARIRHERMIARYGGRA
jgi:hypothetical protein